MKKYIILILIGFIGVTFMSLAQQTKKDKILLRYSLKKGEGLLQIIDNQNTIKVDETEIRTINQWTTKNIIIDIDTSGRIAWEAFFEKIYLKQTYDTEIIEYDSEDKSKEIPESAKFLAILKGKKIKYNTLPTGKVLGVFGIQNQNNGAYQSINNTVYNFPEQPVGVGDTWSLSNTSKNPFLSNKEILSTIQYTFSSRKDGKATITFQGKKTSEGKEVGAFSGNMVIEEVSGIVLEGITFEKLDIIIEGYGAKMDVVNKISCKKI
jgi:hypothetical protein